jgi:hypothetical protein
MVTTEMQKPAVLMTLTYLSLSRSDVLFKQDIRKALFPAPQMFA